MSLLTTPSDIIGNIMSFIGDRYNTRLIRSCKSLCTYGRKYGYISAVNVNLHSNMMIFIQRLCQHSLTLESVIMRGIDDPHIWLPRYFERMSFEHCKITKYVNPGPRSNPHVVKSFKLIDYHRYKFKTKLRVNWYCFPNLEELELYVHDIEMTGLDKLKKLKKINIDTATRGKIIHI
jgi:hypothetical protein